MTAYAELNSKAARIRHIKSMLSTNASWAMRGCQRIFEFQTYDEQNTESTRELNGVGFNGCDAEILSSFAKQINEGRFVGSDKQMRILFKKMPKYARQLEAIASATRSVDQTEQMRDPNEEERRYA